MIVQIGEHSESILNQDNYILSQEGRSGCDDEEKRQDQREERC